MGFPKYHVQIALLHAVMVRSLDAGNKHRSRGVNLGGIEVQI